MLFKHSVHIHRNNCVVWFQKHIFIVLLLQLSFIKCFFFLFMLVSWIGRYFELVVGIQAPFEHRTEVKQYYVMIDHPKVQKIKPDKKKNKGAFRCIYKQTVNAQ